MENVLLTISVVFYNTSKDDQLSLLSSFESLSVPFHLIIIDNSTKSCISPVFEKNCNCTIINTPTNVGFGAGHNLALEKVYQLQSKYHLILNPDVQFRGNTINEMLEYLKGNEDIAILSPKILYPNETLQYSCRLLPLPYEILLRRVPFLKPLKVKMNFRHEMRFTGYNKIMDIPFLLGCFWMVRSNILLNVQGFDERFFLYFEDTDLCRRINRIGRTVFFPNVFIYHRYERSSSTSLKTFYFHLLSFIKYFNKWGWFIDKERRRINNECMRRIE